MLGTFALPLAHAHAQTDSEPVTTTGTKTDQPQTHHKDQPIQTYRPVQTLKDNGASPASPPSPVVPLDSPVQVNRATSPLNSNQDNAPRSGANPQTPILIQPNTGISPPTIGSQTPSHNSDNTYINQDPVLLDGQYTTFDDALIAYKNGNPALALVHAKLAASQGDVAAQVMTGHILMNGETGLVDTDEAAKWYLLAAEQNDTDAMVALGELSLREQAGLTASDALTWFSRAATLGRTDAMRAMAELYISGHGVQKSPQDAQSWLKKAGRNGDIVAARRLADILLASEPKEALLWYERAAANGDHEAAYIAAIMYAENFSIRPDAEKAATLMRQAADSGHAAAIADYGLLLYQGNGVERNIEEAASYFSRSARQGDREGQFLYAFTLAKGEGVERSYDEAYYWLLKSEQNNAKTVQAYEEDRKVFRQELETLLNADRREAVEARLRREQ